MEAWLLDGLGGLDKLRLATADDPKPAEGEVVLEVDYAALNPADRYLAEGMYPARPSFPHVLGRDAVGTVVAAGPGVRSLKPGDRRMVLRGEVGVNKPGTFARRVAVPVDYLVEIPQGWSDTEAAGATLVYLTAYQALMMWPDLPAPAVVLVTGASGGVGVATIELAVAMGYTAIGLSRSAEKSQRLRDLGAALVLDPADTQWRRRLKEHLGPRRVDLAVDNIAGPLLPQVIDTLGDRGRVSCVGALAGPVPQFNTATLFFRRLRMGGVVVSGYSNAEARAAWQAVVDLLKRTGAKPLVDRVFAFEQLPAAFARLAEGPMGKVLLDVKPAR